MKRNHRPLPKFSSEKEEREFWLTHDSADYFDLSKAKEAVFPDLRLTTRAVSIRLPESLLAEIKAIAHKKDVPYQSLMKIFLAERVKQEVEGS